LSNKITKHEYYSTMWLQTSTNVQVARVGMEAGVTI